MMSTACCVAKTQRTAVQSSSPHKQFWSFKLFSSPRDARHNRTIRGQLHVVKAGGRVYIQAVLHLSARQVPNAAALKRKKKEEKP